ncbi:hypothetical protein GDO86_012528 [Hymenochirus boettgeri]|uniref:Uncharacterized protein n=1 Tax=Hymenochirus boettgeri TaxID=247094 RepID=A0A8T2IT67_9PIPI|nr:hypothetical protein GDO86_012528 [Hymenochirus boettgeri]
MIRCFPLLSGKKHSLEYCYLCFGSLLNSTSWASLNCPVLKVCKLLCRKRVQCLNHRMFYCNIKKGGGLSSRFIIYTSSLCCVFFL